MKLYPAIDLKDGNCVRLYKGEMSEATIFNDNPLAQAKSFANEGAEFLHIVDLNGAFAGEPVNGDAVSAILEGIDKQPGFRARSRRRFQRSCGRWH